MLSQLLALALAVPVLVVAVAIPTSTNDTAPLLKRDDPCDNYQFMVRGN